MRKLATIRKIADIQPIDGADKIELAKISGWQVVIAKDVGHKIGDKVVYCEIDSYLPIQPEFEFLRKTSYKKMSNGDEGFRLKTIRLRGEISQGLIIPLNDASILAARLANEQEDPDDYFMMFSEMELGTDITNLLGIVKYDPPVPAQLAGKAKGSFPGFIPKTDQERVQNIDVDKRQFIYEYDDKGKKSVFEKRYFITEKLDGSSFTCYYRDGEFGVCSRNLELIETEDNTFWQVARKLDLENKLKSVSDEVGNIALQGELIGPGIQKNMYGLTEPTVKFFDVFSIDKRKYLPFTDTHKLIHAMQLESVPLLQAKPAVFLPDSIDEILELAEGKTREWKGNQFRKAEREGIVFVEDSPSRFTFKAISNKYLLKN